MNEKRSVILGLCAAATLLIAAAVPVPAQSDDAQTCLSCHSKDGGAPVPDLRGFSQSPHASLGCTACHTDAGEMPHAKKPGPVDCAACHPGPANALKATVHGRMILKNSPAGPGACETCHGRGHQLRHVKDPASPVARAHQPETCGACHGIPGKAASMPDGHTALESYKLTVHGEAQALGVVKAAACADCHGSHEVRAPGDPASRVAKRNIASTCGACHTEEAKAFRASVHGSALAKGIREAPTCTDCHGEHTIRSPKEKDSSVWRGAITKTCAGCHASTRIITKFGMPADRVQTFMDSYHGLAGKSGDLRVANCASCHGWHDVLPAADPRSRVNPANLAQTCGQCHPNASVSLTGGRVHQSLSGEGDGSKIASWLRLFYLFAIPMTIGGMLFHNGLDLLRHALAVRPLPHLKEEGEDVLMNVRERIQHAALMLSFVALAFTGFALKFPGAWDALGLARLGGESLRLNSHRVAALLFVILGVLHLGYMIIDRTGRGRLWALLPAKRDLYDPLHLFLFNLGLSKDRPKLARWSYIEKAEYWALMWGSCVMIATGAILIFHNFALAHFPLWIIESARVVHFMEATLACLSILIWHGYWVMFDPDIYPMNWAWLTGKSHLHEKEKGEDSD